MCQERWRGRESFLCPMLHACMHVGCVELAGVLVPAYGAHAAELGASFNRIACRLYLLVCLSPPPPRPLFLPNHTIRAPPHPHRKQRASPQVPDLTMPHISSAPPSIPGYQLSNDEAHDLRRGVADLLQRDNIRFPGAQPVSFARQHMAELQHREYFMCEKTDGLRCLLYLSYGENPETNAFEPATFLIDRKNSYYNVTPPIRVPYHGAVFNGEAFLYGTILDGELVVDLYPDGSTKLVFYVFDCLCVDAENMTDKPLDKRLYALKEKVMKPWHTWLTQTKTLMPLEPFQVKEKEQQQSYHISYVFDQVMPKLKHGNDGLIFTCKGTR